MSTPDFTSHGLTLKAVPKKPGWFHGPVGDWQQAKELAARLLDTPSAPRFQILVGHLDGDKGHRIYVTPLLTIRELVEVFRVGERSEMSYSKDADETIDRVATRLEAIQKICPFVVTFADAAGLHAEFTRKLTESAATEIESLYPMDDAMQDGLDGYVSEWEGEGPILVPRLVREQSIQLWWD
jgi:hypothetical protein